MSSLAEKIAFSSLKSINAELAQQFLARLGDESEFFKAKQPALAAVMGFQSRLFDSDYRAKLLDDANREIEFVERNCVRTLYFTDPDYPQRLHDAIDAPLMLYSLGDVDFNRGHFVSIVGTRHATPYGIDFVQRLVNELTERLSEPVTIVSGLAFGIDAAAHKAALKSGAPTVGVLAHGLNTIYPAQHRSMAAEMARGGGALLTEYSSQSAIHKGNFIARNRIVASISDCVIVAESAPKGGSLITARLANDYSRDVFALPGRTSDLYSQGCNKLIANNIASLLQNAEQLAKEMRWTFRTETTQPSQLSLFNDLSAEEQAVVDYLKANSQGQLNKMSIDLNLNIGRMMSVMVDLEFKGIVLTYPGGVYRLA